MKCTEIFYTVKKDYELFRKNVEDWGIGCLKASLNCMKSNQFCL